MYVVVFISITSAKFIIMSTYNRSFCGEIKKNSAFDICLIFAYMIKNLTLNEGNFQFF